MLLERDGVLVPQRAENGYRLYTEAQARQAGIARKLKAAGLSAAGIRDVMERKRGAARREGKLAAIASALERAKVQLVEKRRAVDEAIARLDSLIAECRAECRVRSRGRMGP
jgi:DNA-binding transcriptional MerR regulator